MKDFIAVVFLAAFVFILSLIFFRGYGPIVFVFIVIAGLVSVIMNQEARIEKMEKILGVKENNEKSEKDEEKADEITSQTENE